MSPLRRVILWGVRSKAGAKVVARVFGQLLGLRGGIGEPLATLTATDSASCYRRCERVCNVGGLFGVGSYGQISSPSVSCPTSATRRHGRGPSAWAPRGARQVELAATRDPAALGPGRGGDLGGDGGPGHHIHPGVGRRGRAVVEQHRPPRKHRRAPGGRAEVVGKSLTHYYRNGARYSLRGLVCRRAPSERIALKAACHILVVAEDGHARQRMAGQLWRSTPMPLGTSHCTCLGKNLSEATPRTLVSERVPVPCSP